MSSKDEYKSAMSKLAELVETDHQPLLRQIDHYMGELRRKNAVAASHLDENQRTINALRSEVDDLTRLRARVAALDVEKAALAVQCEELRRVVPEWREIEEGKTFVTVKAKCLRCGLHFALYTWYPGRHTAATIRCPECGQRHGNYIVWQTTQEEQYISQKVGACENDYMTDLRLPNR